MRIQFPTKDAALSRKEAVGLEMLEVQQQLSELSRKAQAQAPAAPPQEVEVVAAPAPPKCGLMPQRDGSILVVRC